MAGATTEVTASNFKQEVLQASVPVVVDYWAAWCGPCKMIAPVLEELAKELAGQIKFVKVNVDEFPELASQHNVMNIPTLIGFKQGQEATRIVGFSSKRDLAAKLQALLT